jgi:sporulation protein YlmC with PRC-barrel domain
MNTINQAKRAPIDGNRGSTAGAAADQLPDIVSTSTFMGLTVISADGQDVGRVLEVMADMRSGRIAYAVLAEGEFLGTALTLRAIPWGALTFDINNECFRLAMSAQKITDAPAFDGDNWPPMADPAWGQRIHKYYNRPPY